MGSSAKSGGGGSGSYDYYGDFMGVVCYGPVDEIVSLVVDGTAVWTPDVSIKREESSNPYVLMVEGYGKVYFYWGTEDQILNDPVSTEAGRLHPNYRHRCIAVYEQFLCGRERTSVPDISWIVRKKPLQTVTAPMYNFLDEDGQANGFASLLYFLTDQIAGLGMADSQFNATSWEAAGYEIALHPEREYLTIPLKSKTRVNTLINSLNGYYDTWFRQDEEGRIEVGRFDNNGTVHPITIHDLVAGSRPSFQGTSMIDVDGRVILEFTDRDLSYETNHSGFNNPARIEGLDRSDPVEIKRPWIRRSAQAAYKVAEEGYRESLPHHAFTLVVREERADLLMPGELVSYEIEVADLVLIARIISRSGDSSDGGDVTIKVETLRVSDQITAGGIDDLNSVNESSELADLDYWIPLQLPVGFNGDPYQVVALAGRTRSLDTGARVHYKKASSTDYNQLGVMNSWAVPVQLAAGYLASDTGDLIITELMDPDPLGFNALPTTQTSEEISDDNLLLITKNATGEIEVMTIRQILASTITDYSIEVSRGTRGSTAVTHDSEQLAYIIRRSSLRIFSTQALDNCGAVGDTIDLKLTPMGRGELPLVEASSKQLTLIPEPAAPSPEPEPEPAT